MDAIRKLIRDKAEERELSLSWLSRRMGRNNGYLHDYVEKGSPRLLSENDRRLLAEHLGVSENYLRPDSANPGAKGALAPEGEQITVEDIRDPRLRDVVQRELRAVKRGEVWIINTPLIEAKYPPGTIVIADVGAHAYENDYVLAEVWNGKERAHVFRKYIPPNLVVCVVSSPATRGYTVDRETVIIRGVIRVGFR